MLQSPLKGESAGLETSDAKGTLLDLCTGCIDQEQDVISQLSFQQGGGLAQVRQNLAIIWGEGWVLGALFRVMYHAAKG